MGNESTQDRANVSVQIFFFEVWVIKASTTQGMYMVFYKSVGEKRTHGIRIGILFNFVYCLLFLIKEINAQFMDTTRADTLLTKS